MVDHIEQTYRNIAAPITASCSIIKFGQYFAYNRSLAYANFTTVIVTTTRF